ncbi:hypothetical protein M3C61_13190 [Dermacoccus abyssi]|uniref:Uncharacterized protein n=1 Tax=Dermacoccus abyssi TaxID=322596 RepID=A0ABX5Z942_9MICO|nr:MULTISPECIES: hypothetical protein [Dermacoccus]MBE7371206.1 hypothetical protein [Dermacoccus barathri]MCT1987954.1 hypothetical protein [Dermacoccus abyssi]QEH93457.1 hypothetical protein FV141_07935 [Dermacoccus abyssi]
MPKVAQNTGFTAAVDAVVVVRGEVSRVTSWVERGTVPAYVIDIDGPWCAVVPAGPGHAQAPYDDPAQMIAARPVPMALRPSLAFVPTEKQAITVVQPRAWRSLPRWFVVQQGIGPVRAALPQASLGDLLSAGHDAHPEALERVLAQPDAAPADLLRGIMAALGVNAGHLLGLARTAKIDAVLVEPTAKAVRRFDKHVTDEREERAEIEGRVNAGEKS